MRIYFSTGKIKKTTKKTTTTDHQQMHFHTPTFQYFHQNIIGLCGMRN